MTACNIYLHAPYNIPFPQCNQQWRGEAASLGCGPSLHKVLKTPPLQFVIHAGSSKRLLCSLDKGNANHCCHDFLLDCSRLRTLTKEPGPPSSLIISTSTTVCLYSRSSAVEDALPSETTLLSAYSPRSEWLHACKEVTDPR